MIAECRRIHLHARLADLLFHIQFDRQAVAIPTRNIRRIETAQRFRFDNNVFQDFIDGMADMQIAVGIRRPVVQNEFIAAGAGGANRGVQIFFLPALHLLRFALGQIGLHRELGLGQVQSVFVIAHTIRINM